MPDEFMPIGHRVALAPQQTVASAQDTRDALLAALAEGERLVIDCAGVAEADLTIVQLLLAARASAARLGKTVVLTGTGGGALRQALEDCGAADDRFWRGED